MEFIGNLRMSGESPSPSVWYGKDDEKSAFNKFEVVLQGLWERTDAVFIKVSAQQFRCWDRALVKHDICYTGNGITTGPMSPFLSVQGKIDSIAHTPAEELKWYLVC